MENAEIFQILLTLAIASRKPFICIFIPRNSGWRFFGQALVAADCESADCAFT
jgi:hypothetical protein